MKRSLLRSRRVAVSVAAAFVIASWCGEAMASFHFMRIQQVMAGSGGDSKVQFVELRLTSIGQNFVSGHTLTFYDAAGHLTGTFTFPSNVTNGATGSSILIGTEEFKAVSTVAPDFIMPPLVNFPDGRVTWAAEAIGTFEPPSDPSVAYGAFTGSMTVGSTNYGAPAPALPIAGLQSLLRTRTATPFNNSTDYALATPAPRNNAGQTGEVKPPATGIQPGDITIHLQQIAGGLASPIYLTHAGDGSGRLFVVDQTGLILVLRDGKLLPRPFLDLRSKTVAINPGYDERGVLGIAFHPQYASNGRFFVRYSVPRDGAPDEPCADPTGFIVGCHKEVLSEFHVSSDPDAADPASETELFSVDKPQFNHNAGQVLFGPDGFLYFSLGDGGGANDGLADNPPSHGPTGNAQNLQVALGKLHRIDVDGAKPFQVPPDNPFVGMNALESIWAYGLRNPYRFSFDRGGAHELFLADVGQDLFEEVDLMVKGGNYGWPIHEGLHCFDPFHTTTPPETCPTAGFIDPLAEYDHNQGIAAIGGFVYRGSRFPELVGKYVFADLTSGFSVAEGKLLYIDMAGDRSKIFSFLLGASHLPLGLAVKGLGEDEAGEIYVLASTNVGPGGTGGQIYRIAREAPNQIAGDLSQDGKVDITDAIQMLGFLFLGSPTRLPCGDGTSAHSSNKALVDWNGDGGLDLSDPVGLLGWLFLGGKPDPFFLDRTGDGAPDATCIFIPDCPSIAPPCD
jgi:glucose/arabinose dehydrogenase